LANIWQNQLFFYEDFGSLILSLSLTLPPAQRAYGPEGTLNPEPVNAYFKLSLDIIGSIKKKVEISGI